MSKTFLLILIIFRVFVSTIFLTLFVLSGSENIEIDGDVCEIGEHGKCGENKAGEIYTNEYNVILHNIESALKTYVPCASDGDKNCSCHAETISNDLKPFRGKGITKELIDSSGKYGTRYKVLNHKLYREDRCMFPARCTGIEHFILSIIKRLGNMDLIINTRDWPQIYTRQKYPVFSFSKTKDYTDIMYPAWSFWCGGPAITLHPTGIGRWDLQRERLQRAAISHPWDKKVSRAFFRGSRTSDERDALILLSRQKPHLVDAQYTKNQAWKSSKDTLYAEPAKEVSFEEHCRYKYLFNFRGVAASFRLKHLFLCKSLVFHVGEDWNEFYYFAMKPWVHYIPLHNYPTDKELESILDFFKKHDDLALEIAERGFNFIWNHLRMEDVECFWERLLKEYQHLIKYEVTFEKDMHEII